MEDGLIGFPHSAHGCVSGAFFGLPGWHEEQRADWRALRPPQAGHTVVVLDRFLDEQERQRAARSDFSPPHPGHSAARALWFPSRFLIAGVFWTIKATPSAGICFKRSASAFAWHVTQRATVFSGLLSWTRR